MIISAGAVVAGDEVLRPGWIEVSQSVITVVGRGEPPRAAGLSVDDGTLIPGFVDMHVHGGGGASFTSKDPTEAAAAAAFHQRHGTTSMLASLVSASPRELLSSVSMLADLVRDGVLCGIHLEGPWLAPGKRGAHDPSTLRHPDAGEINRLIASGRGAITMVTLAPELPGGLSAVRHLTEAGIRVAIGHTDADYDTTRKAIDAGAGIATHLFNAMPPLHHRDPGPVAALIQDPRVTLELIADGTHLHPATVAHVVAAAGPARVAFVTDSMAAAGMPDGTFSLGGLSVQVTGGVARLADGTIAGSTATMADTYTAALAAYQGPREALVAASMMTSTTSARALTLSRDAALTVGSRADIVVLDAHRQVQAVMSAGAWVQTDA